LKTKVNTMQTKTKEYILTIALVVLWFLILPTISRFN